MKLFTEANAEANREQFRKQSAEHVEAVCKKEREAIHIGKDQRIFLNVPICTICRSATRRQVVMVEAEELNYMHPGLFVCEGCARVLLAQFTDTIEDEE